MATMPWPEAPAAEAEAAAPAAANGGDSDTEDDPGHLLNMWLGELNTLKRGLDTSNPKQATQQETAPVVRRRQQREQQQQQQQQQQQLGVPDAKAKYRCSLINLETSQDEELDAILGELSVLESQFADELTKPVAVSCPPAKESPTTTDSGRSSSGESNSNSRASPSNSSSSNNSNARAKPPPPAPPPRSSKGRTESPDNDSAFCDNVSVVSSSCSSSTARDLQPSDEAKVKAEKIRLAIEKIKEASIKKLFVKVFTADGSAKSLLIDEKMSVGHVCRLLAEKNHVQQLDPKWALVELVPDLYLERVYEDDENLVENCLLWKVDSKNTLWFVERPEKFDVFVRPELYLLGASSSQRHEQLEEHARRQLLEEYFGCSPAVAAPEVEGSLWLKAESKKSWKKYHFVLRSSGLYYAPKAHKKGSRDLVCLATFDVNQVYYGAGWRKKYKAPTEYGFAIKHPKLQAKSPKHIRYLCVDSERELHRWVTGIRVAKHGKRLFDNYRAIEDEITHADIDILTSKRFSSVNASGNGAGAATVTGNGLSVPISPARTPSSENKSLDSALSSGIVSDLSSSTTSSTTALSCQPRIDEDSSSSSQNLTPVNTLERAQSTSGSSSISAGSSACPSGMNIRIGPKRSQQSENGFESDFPAGGTIKKRPAAVQPPRLPLTHTTWGLVVRDSDDDAGDQGPNVRVGGGGTLLRNTVVRQNFHRQQVRAEVHQAATDDEVDPMSAAFESQVPDMDPDKLPPPPPPEPAYPDPEELPPPPPELLCPQPDQAQQSQQPQQPQPSKGRRISFDDKVQFLGTLPRQQYPQPKQLYTSGGESEAAPPRAFLQDLQKLMDKKWQVAEKCRVETGATPHQVLGFRDEVHHLVGQPQSYSRDNSVGQWVLQSQQFRQRDEPPPPPPPAAVGSRRSPSPSPPLPPPPPEPLYAIARRNGSSASPSHYAPSQALRQQPQPQPPMHQPPVPVVLREPTPEYDPYATLGEVRTESYRDVSNYSTLNFSGANPSPSSPACSTSSLGLSPVHRSSFRSSSSSGSGGSASKRPPPPPKRSENTQLTMAPVSS